MYKIEDALRSPSLSFSLYRSLSIEKEGCVCGNFLMKLFLVIFSIYFLIFYHDKKIDIQEKENHTEKSFLYARISQSNSFFTRGRGRSRNGRCRVWAVVLKGAKFTNRRSFIFAWERANKKKLVSLPTDDERSAFQFFQCAEGKKIIYWHLALVSFKLLAIYILELLPYRCQTGGEGAGRRDGSIFKYFFIISRAPPRGRRALVLYVISYFFLANSILGSVPSSSCAVSSSFSLGTRRED